MSMPGTQYFILSQTRGTCMRVVQTRAGVVLQRFSLGESTQIELTTAELQVWLQSLPTPLLLSALAERGIGQEETPEIPDPGSPSRAGPGSGSVAGAETVLWHMQERFEACCHPSLSFQVESWRHLLQQADIDPDAPWEEVWDLVLKAWPAFDMPADRLDDTHQCGDARLYQDCGHAYAEMGYDVQDRKAICLACAERAWSGFADHVEQTEAQLPGRGGAAMQHRKGCLDAHAAHQSLFDAFWRQYPYACRVCGGVGLCTTLYDPSPASVFLSAGHLFDTKACPSCEGHEPPHCALCARPLSLDNDRRCGCPRDVFSPPEPTCVCWEQSLPEFAADNPFFGLDDRPCEEQ